MNVLGFSGIHESVSFKKREFPGLSPREYRIVQGLDSAAALVRDGSVTAAAAEERFTREKGTGTLPVHAIDYCLRAGGLKPGDIDFVAHGFSYEPWRSTFEAHPVAQKQFLDIYARDVQLRHLQACVPSLGSTVELVQVSHHLAHAASAYYLSGFEESLILVTDGMGEMDSATVSLGRGDDIQTVRSIRAPHSLGIFYGVFTLYLGFFMNMDEYKVMGLAPYGNPHRFYSRIMAFIHLEDDGTYTIPILRRNSSARDKETYAGTLRELTEIFGPPREPGSPMTTRDVDVAAGLQAALQTAHLHLLRHAKRDTGATRLCMAGGVALNCVLNGVIRRSRLFKECFVQPAAGDDGSALGAALYVERTRSSRSRPARQPKSSLNSPSQEASSPSCRMGVPLWGPEYSDDECREALAGRNECRSQFLSSFADVCAETARRISKGEIVAWFQGRMEFGPRALGNRSLLADARAPGMRDRINGLIKQRESFRPFAPAVTAEAASRYFEIDEGDAETFAHMLFVTRVRPEFRDAFPAVTHVDGSARVQAVFRAHNPRFWELLEAVARETGVPIVLNTSLNLGGEPIVCSPDDAINTFLKGGLDVLVLGHHLIERTS